MLFILYVHIETFFALFLYQYPVADNAFEFQMSLVEATYGLNIWDQLRALVNVLKMLSEQNTAAKDNTSIGDESKRAD